MVFLGKRSGSISRDISPPPLRRKLEDSNSGNRIMPVLDAIPSAPLPPSTSNPTPTPVTPLYSTNLFRIFSWNVNGIGPFLQKPITSFFTRRQGPSSSFSSTSHPNPTGHSLRSFLRRHNFPEFLCLQEVKIASKDDATKRALERAANTDGRPDNGPNYTAHYCLPRDIFNAKGFGGRIYGMATFIRDDFLARHVTVTREVGWDQEGRVLIMELTAAPARHRNPSSSISKLAIINGYWVNGTTNPYRDPASGLVSGMRHDRKRAFHSLMLAECRTYEAAGWLVILIGYMNISRGPLDGYPGIRLAEQHVKNRADFNSKFFLMEDGLKGVDVWRFLRGEERRYTYYGRGVEWGSSCDRVDLIIVSKKLTETPGLLIDCEILDTQEERGHSDHVPLYVTLDMEKLE